jgi:hypothetical protein
MHDPDLKAKHMEMSAKGGRSKASMKPVDIHIDLSTAEAILESVNVVAKALVAGELDRERANAVGYLAATASKALGVIQHERRLRRVETALNLREDTDAE